MLNRRFGGDSEDLLLTPEDLENIVRHLIDVSNGDAEDDDIDHLANRRVRTAGELVQEEFAAGLFDMVKATTEALQLAEYEPSRPRDCLKSLALVKRIAGFFNGSKLCQVTDETNPIAELTHKRRITSLGPGGLNRQNAGVDARDVHHTHYGKICPIETPEGQNIGLLCTLAIAADVDEHGLLTTPVRPVRNSLSSHSDDICGRTLREDIVLDGAVLERSGQRVTAELCAELRGMPERDVGVIPFVANTLEDVERVNAYREMDLVIAQCNAGMDDKGQLEDDWIEARHGERWLKVLPGDVDYVELTPRQVVSASTSMIPFLEHDDANRALMGCNMQRQAVPLVKPQTALVTTGMEVDVARDSGYQVRAERGGVVTAVSADRIDVRREDGVVDTYELLKARRSNAFTWISQTPAVNRWLRVGEGDVLADGHASREGELALGQRVLVAYMSWDGYNYEDAIILSDRVVREGKFRSRILKRFRLDAVDVSLVEHDEDGKEHIRKVPERITRDVPDVADWRKELLGEDGIVPVGTYVKPGQILVGRASPKPTPADLQGREMPGEQKLLFAIFGETADQVRYSDKSLLLPKGQQGRVVRVNVIRKDDNSEASKQLPPGCHTRIEVEVAGTRSVQPGDKMSGRHGNKGCVSIVVPQEDMPFLPDGTPIDVMLSPLGVPSRMNLGQLMEVHLGWAAHRLGFRARTSVFDSATWDEVEQCMAQAWLAGRAGGIGNRIAEDDMHSVDWDQVKLWCKKEGYSFEGLFGEAATRGTEPGRVCLSIWLEDEGFDVPAGLTYEQLKARVIEIDRVKDKAGPIMGKQVLRDGRTGERMGKPVMVGYKYMIKLGHMVEDKMHARSTGTYSSITQQPLRGKSAGGGQRLGEMEVWALEGYSAAYILQEMLTLKSDDVEGRRMTLDAIMAGGGTGLAKTTRILPNVPDSFNLLCAELRSMGMDVQRVNEEISYIYEEPNLGLSEESYANEMES